MALSINDAEIFQSSRPQAWEGPVLRTIDITDNIPVMIVTTSLRRLWLIDPSQTFGTSREDLAREFDTVMQANGNYITGAAPGRAWDDTVWRRRTRYRLLESPIDPTRNISGSPLSVWTDHIRRTYNNVFWDMYQTLKLEASHIGNFAPEDPDNVLLLNIELSNAPGNEVVIFDRDTFLFPVWLKSSTSVVITADGHAHEWTSEVVSWNHGVWVRRGIEVVISTKSDTSSGHHLAAVLVQGRCELPEVPKPFGYTKEGKLEDPDMPQLATEATHLARAVWLCAGDITNDCSFGEAYAPVQQSLADRELIEEQVLHGQNQDLLYKPLPHASSIRLLYIAPGDENAVISLNLVLVDLRNNPNYEALSYTWGDPQDTVQISCGSRLVTVPRNLQDALYRLRDPAVPRYVWADAICINQEDIKERGQQVAIMRDIFHGATRVLVWLGQDRTHQAVTAFKAVCDIVRSWKPPGDKFAYNSYAEAFEPLNRGARQYLHRTVDKDAWNALRYLYSSTYFRRFWIIQELSLSQSAIVVWGKHHIAWPLVGICATWLLSKGWDFQIGAPITTAYNAFLIYVLPLARHSSITHFSRLDLSAILGITVGIFDSTDPKDRIYALLGMPFSGNGPEQDPLIKPDYTENLRSIYTQAATRMLQQDQHLRLLSSVQHGEELDDSWPSWVPKWNETYNAEPLALREEQGYYANAGELFVPSEESFSEDGNGIFLNGLEYDTITDVSELMTRYKHGHRALSRDKDLEALNSIMKYFLDEEKQFRSSWSSKIEQYTIFGFTDPDRQAEIVKDGFRSAAASGSPGKYGIRSSVETLTGDRAQVDHLGEFLIYWRERSSWRPSELLHVSEAHIATLGSEDNSFFKELLLCSLNTLWGRRIFHCGNGKFGLGPAAAQPGDRVVVLFGGIVPFVLRPVEGGTWRFVGECFVPGLMQGEVVEEAGLLEQGKFERTEQGALRLELESEAGVGQRFQRKVGEKGVQRFEIT